MPDYIEAIVKSLVAVAWADGKVTEEETEVIEALIVAFGVSGEHAEMIREYASTPRTIDEIPLTELSAHDRRMLMQYAIIVTFVDGEQSAEELALLDELEAALHLDAEEAKVLRDAATARAKQHLSML